MALERRGHIKIARKAFADDKWWREKRVFSKWEAWEDMIQLAQWEAREFTSTKFGTIRLERGEFILSLRKMAERWNWGLQSVRTFTRSATFRTRLATQRETQAGTVYRIVNYDLYQSTDPDLTQPATQQSTHLQHTSNTRTSSKAVKHLTTTVASRRERYAFMGTLRPIWKAKYGGDMPKGAAKDLAPLHEELGLEVLSRRFTNYVAATDATYCSVPHFKHTHGSWDVTSKQNGHLSQEEEHRRRGWIA